jgi:hypothetical protein
MNPPDTPTPRTDAAWAKTFLDDDDQCRAGNAATDMRDECATLERELLAANECAAIANRSADDQMHQKREAQRELADWSVLKGWGGTPEIVHKFIKGQQHRIHYCQNIEAELAALTIERDELRSEVERLTKQAVFDGDHIHTLNAAFATRAEVTDANARAEKAEAELAAERARLDWLLLDNLTRFDDSISHRTAIDAAMQKGEK